MCRPCYPHVASKFHWGGYFPFLTGYGGLFFSLRPYYLAVELEEPAPLLRPKRVQIDCIGLGGHDLGGEFLVLHFFATDSAQGWDTFLAEALAPGKRRLADERRAAALAMFPRGHIAPSYRRLPHVTWVDSVSLVLDLLIGTGKQRYLCILHLLWALPHIQVSGKLGCIACPPELLESFLLRKGNIYTSFIMFLMSCQPTSLPLHCGLQECH